MAACDRVAQPQVELCWDLLQNCCDFTGVP
jgi:hypothetical protein